MNLGNLKSLYHPIQPTASGVADQVVYQEFVPDTNLQDSIYCYWLLKSVTPLDSDYEYRVVADGCIDIFFNCKEPIKPFVMGFCKRFTPFILGREFTYLGVRFLPSTFSNLFDVSALELSNQFRLLTEVVPKIAHGIMDNSWEGIGPAQAARLFDQLFLREFQLATLDWDERFYNALIIILQSKGMVESDKGLDTGLSPRQLRRIFNYYIGTTPKAFSKVVRFQHVLKGMQSSQDMSQVFYDLGFYDQAHFIKDFKNFYGVTPNQAFY